MSVLRRISRVQLPGKKMEHDRAGNTQTNRANLYSDYQEISPWNARYIREYKAVDKPLWRYFTGTMSDFHHFLQQYPIALIFFGFFRSSGMFYGISNPFMGLMGLVAAFLDTWYNFIFLCWSIIWSMIWCFVLRVPKELIYNGLYPSQGIVIGYTMYVTYGATPTPQMFTQLIALIPILFFNIVFFEALCSVFVKRLNVTPMMVSGLFLGICWQLAIQKSYHFYTNAVIPTLNHPMGPNATANITFEGRDWFPITGAEYGIEILYGVAMLQFSTSKWSAIPICIGLFSASPIMFLTTWAGSFIGISTVACLAPKWDFVNVRLGLYGINASITMSVLVGNFFILNFASIMLGAFSVMTCMMLNMAIQSLCTPLGTGWFALPATIVCILAYMTAGSFPSLIPVELVSLTVPEDHLRRFWLSKKIIAELHMGKALMDYKDLSPQKLQSIERSMLPVLMCSYSKQGNATKIKELMDLGADPNYCDYDGRTALHIASSENCLEVIALLLKWNADINVTDNYLNTPLSDALNAGYFDLAKMLHSKGGVVNLPLAKIASILCYQVYTNELDVLKVWLECGVDPSLADYDNRTPLHIAYSRKNTKAIEILENYRANKELRDRWGMKPMECFGNLVIENMGKADFMETKFPYEPLLRNSTVNMDGDLISTVLIALLNSSSTDKLKDMKQALVPSLICALVYMQEHDTLTQLCQLEMDLNVIDYDLRTPLHIAAASGDMDTVKLLIWNKAKINAKDRFGYTALFEAVQHKNDQVCAHLRNTGAKLCLTAELEVSTLCWAVYNNDFDMITRLVENGVNVEAKDYDERTCYDIAKDLDNPNMVLHIENLKKRLKRQKEQELDSLTESLSLREDIKPKKKKRSSKSKSKSDNCSNGDLDESKL